MIKNPIILIYEFDTEGNITNHIWQKNHFLGWKAWITSVKYFRSK